MKLHPLKYPLRAAAKAICLLAVAALAACSSDEPVDNGKPVPAPDNGMVSVNLALSAPSIETRANYSAIDVKAHEDVVKNLWVYFFNENGNLVKAYEADIDENGYKIKDGLDSDDNGYQGISMTQLISLPGGKYYVYVLANLKDYCDTSNTLDIAPTEVNRLTGDAALTKTKLDAFTFHTKSNATGDLTGRFIDALPMAAQAYPDIKIESSKTDGVNDNTISNGLITLTKGSLTIKATMTYLCAKIRYTFLFDNSVYPAANEGDAPTYGFSYPLKSLEYTDDANCKVGIHNAETYATLFGNSEPTVPNGANKYADTYVIDTTSEPDKGCVRVKYPTDQDPTNWPTLEDWLGATDDVIPGKLEYWGDQPDEGYPTSGKIAYQGYVYIPQNLATQDKEDKSELRTYLHFKVKLDGEYKDFEIILPDKDGNQVLRGNFYDIIGKITATGISFNVRVKPWVDTPNTTVMPLGL